MSEVLPGVFAECKAVERVRIELVFTFEDERGHAEQLTERVDRGAATITVHPRGSMEIARATASQWLIGALALCLLLAGYLVARHAFRELGLEVTHSELRLNQVPSDRG